MGCDSDSGVLVVERMRSNRLSFKLKNCACPACGSLEQRLNWYRRRAFAACLLLGLVPESLLWGGPKKPMRCSKCKVSFRGYHDVRVDRDLALHIVELTSMPPL